MRKKQLFALILTGALTVGMAPSAAFAAEEGSALSIEGETEVGAGEEGEPTPTDPAENPDAGDNGGDNGSGDNGGGDIGDGGQDGEATPTPDPQPTDVPPTEAPTQTPEEVEGNLPQNKETPDATATPTPEVKASSVTMDGTAYNTLGEAVAAATAGVGDEKPSAIIITGDIEIDQTIAVPAGKNVVITAGAENTTISRKEGFKGDLFKIDGATLQFSAGLVNDNGETVPGSLIVDGSQEDATAVDGSLVAVGSGGTFALLDGVTLTGNMTSVNGGAIRNEGGNVALFGGTITGNSAAAGGAVYSTGAIAVKGTVKVTENKGADNLTENNIVLSGETAVINIAGAMTDSEIGVLVAEGAAGAQVIAVAPGVEGVTLADVLSQFTYNAEGLAIDEEGKLKTAEVTPSPTPTEALKLKGIDMKWTSQTSARVTCNSNKDGWYYAAWVTRGSKAPEFDLEKDGVAVKADRNFTIDFTDLDPKKPIDVYVRVKDKEDNLSKKMLFQLDEDTRPGGQTPTPTGRAPIVPKVTESVVQGLDKPLEFYPGVYHKFTVVGAGTQNMDPVQGDVKWVPKYWAMSTNPEEKKKNRSWEVGAKGGLLDAGTYNMYVFFQKNEYDGEQWQELDTIEYARYQFKSAAITITATPTVQGQQGNGNNENGEDPDTKTADGDVTGATSGTGAVATADESPIGSMMTLAMVSLLAGGYVLVRRRKKITE
ncbi:hypothetical protein NXH76_13060 [Blautia schinkii]|nr:hypothetical protein [Blautia schinkii]